MKAPRKGMRACTALAGLALLCALRLAGAQAPQHGGVVVQVRDLELELVASASDVRLYLRALGEPVDLPNTRAQLTVRSGPDQQEVLLKPAGDRLEALGSFQLGPGSQVVAEVAAPGRAPYTARYTLPARP